MDWAARSPRSQADSPAGRAAAAPCQGIIKRSRDLILGCFCGIVGLERDTKASAAVRFLISPSVRYPPVDIAVTERVPKMRAVVCRRRCKALRPGSYLEHRAPESAVVLTRDQ